MPFVKLDAGLLDSSLWTDPVGRDVFITALLMATPRELAGPMAQLAIDSLDPTGWTVPAGWYGFLPSAGVGILRRALVPEAQGLEALKRLGDPDPTSRTVAHQGRRLVRVDGGFVVLNFMLFRERDDTARDRARRYRERLALRRHAVTSRNVTHAEAEAEAEAEVPTQPPTPSRAGKGRSGGADAHASRARFDSFWAAYPKKKAKKDAERAFKAAKVSEAMLDLLLAALERQRRSPEWLKDGGQFIPLPATWLRGGRWEDEIQVDPDTRPAAGPDYDDGWWHECQHEPKCSTAFTHAQRKGIDAMRAEAAAEEETR
jgi:hypothetical protein